MSFLHINDLEFSYPNSTQNYQFNLSLEAGKILALTGRSGTGKSTLLDLIAGFQHPSAGQIVLDGVDIISLSPANRQVSILFQKNNLFEHLSVLENVCLAINPNSKPTAKQVRQANLMLEKVEMAGFAYQQADQLSGGQMQRVALARELLRNSKLLLLDEPFNGLDEETQEIILPLLNNAVKAADRSIILVTHDLDSVSDIVDRVVELRSGQIIASPDNS